MPYIYPIYDISFDFYAKTFASGWHNLIHFTTSGNSGRLGYRFPAIWAHASKGDINSRSLHIVSGVGTNANYVYDTIRLAKRKWHHIQVKQALSGGKLYYYVYVNNKLSKQVENTKPQTYKNMMVYVSDPWYSAVDGYVQNLKIDTTKPGMFFISVWKKFCVNDFTCVSTLFCY